MAQVLPNVGQNYLAGLTGGLQAGSAIQDMNRQNALSQLYKTQGAGLAQGDPEAINALAALDPMTAYDMRRQGAADQRADQQFQMQQDRMDMERQRFSMEQEKFDQEMDAYARSISAEQAAQEAEQMRQAAQMGMGAQSAEQWDEIARANGADNLVGQFENRDAILNRFLTAAETLDRYAGPTPQSSEGKLQADINAGLVDPSAAGPEMYVQISGEEAQARGLDPNKVWQVGPDNKVSEVGASGQTINVNTGGGGKFYESLDEAQGDMFAGLIDQGVTVPQKLAQIDDLDRLLADKNTPEGFEAAFKNFAGNYGINSEGLDSIQAANAIISRLVPEQRPPGSGEMSDADLALFKQSLPRLINTREGNQIILDSLRGIAMYERQQAEVAAQVANRELTPAEGREALSKIENPLQRFRRSGETRIGGGDLVDEETQSLIDKYAG